MRLSRAFNIEDLHQAAKRHLPRVAFDYIEGGAEDERALVTNERGFHAYRLNPHYLVDVSKISQATPLFGRTYGLPFGIAPTGLIGLFRHGGERMLAQAAVEANIPFIMSGASTASIENIAKIAPDHLWYQLYTARDRSISEDMIRRARDAGLSTLVVTVDIPTSANRERDKRNGFGLRMMPASSYVEALRHPAWLMEYLRYGVPEFENWKPYAGRATRGTALADFIRTQVPPGNLTWHDVESFRKLWPRTLVVKGLMRADDARAAVEAGADGIIVSNHGGRQLDMAPSSVEAFPAIRDAVGDRTTLMLDSGVRRGSDVLIARALGARFVFVGRATLYGVSAFGLPGARKAIDILQREMEAVLKQVGCPNVNDLGQEFLWRDGQGPVLAKPAPIPAPGR